MLCCSVYNKLRFGTWDSPDAPQEEGHA
jgi:hypothetical protein